MLSSFVYACVLFATFSGTGSLASSAIYPKNNEVISALQKRGIDLINTDSTGLKVTCISCTTHGNVTFSTGSVGKNASLVKDVTSLFQIPDPGGLVAEAFDLNVKVAFENVGGRFEFLIESGGESTYSFPLFSLATPFGAALSEDLNFGMALFVDLVFSLSAEVDLTGGFELAFPAGAFITVDPLLGTIVEHGFTGGKTNALPITVTTATGGTTFKASLRVRVQAGTTVSLFGTGFDFELGIFVDLIEYVATISSTPECPQLISGGLDVAIGAYAHAVGEVNYATFGAAPAVITTILEVPLSSQCLDGTAPTSVPGYAMNSVAPVVSTSSVAPFSSTSLQTKTNLPASGYPAGSAVTPAPALITSTVCATDLITLTTCSSTVLHCPANATADFVITKTRTLYTTVCPPGATLPTTLPAYTAVPRETSTATGPASYPAYPAVPLSLSTPKGLVETSSAIPLASYPPNAAVPPSSTTCLTTTIEHTITITRTITISLPSAGYPPNSALLPSSTVHLTETIRLTKIHTTTITRTTSISLSSPAPPALTTVVITQLNFVPCASAIVETIYTPNLTTPVYAMPTGVAFPVPFPNWNETVPTFRPIVPIVPVVTSTNVTTEPVAGTPASNPFMGYVPSTTGPLGHETPIATPEPGNATESTTGNLPNPTYPIAFQNAASRSIDPSSAVLALVLSTCVFALL
ncbi:hypothetical protein PZA11_006962 [Diplocarpon coronariae]